MTLGIVMVEYVTVNGARIERSFFDENVGEARSCEWSREQLHEAADHRHCIVCGIAISRGYAYRCGHRWLCEYCHETFL